MKPGPYFASAFLGAAMLAAGSAPFAQQADPNIAAHSARRSPEWLKSGVLYQGFVRSFSSPTVIPFVSLSGFGAGIFEKQARQDKP